MGSVTFTELYEGTHAVTLSGLAGNCTLGGTSSRMVTVSPGRTASLTFSASCTPTGTGSGTLTVTATTTGSDVDPDGYTLVIDGSWSQAIDLAKKQSYAVASSRQRCRGTIALASVSLPV